MSKFLTILRSAFNNTAENAMKSSLKRLGFDVSNKDAIKHEIKRLDREVFDLIDDDDAYWANRKACWNLTSLLIGEVK